jgi:hypothetical protein
MLRKLLAFFFVCFLFSSSFADESVDLKHLTAECIEAAMQHEIIEKDFIYKVLHTVRYKGWSGDAETFELVYPIEMEITYAGTSKSGFYWFLLHPKKKIKVSAKSDLRGNFELVEDTGNKIKGYKFRGLMKGGTIKGVWNRENGQKSFAFSVKAIEKKSPQ